MRTILSQPNPGSAEGVSSTEAQATTQAPQTSAPKKERNINFARIIETLYGVMLFLLPVFFLPFTAEAFNLNKTFLVLYIAVLSLILFFFQGWRKGNLHFQGFKLYLPVALLLLAAIASAIFSINRDVSLFGRYGNYNASLMFLVGVLIIFFVSSNTKLNIVRLAKFLVAGVTLATLFSFLGFYGVSMPLFGTLVPGYSLVGSFLALIGLQAITVLIAFYFLSRKEDLNMFEKVLMGMGFVLPLTYVLVTMNYIAIAIIVLGLIYLFFSSPVDLKVAGKLFGPIIFVTLLLVLIHLIPTTRDSLGINTTVTVPRLSVNQSWFIASSTVRDFPFTGTGLGSFVIDFSRYRPASLNATDYWNFRFSYPTSDLFLWLATAGLVGAFAYFTFIVTILIGAKKANKDGFSNYLVASLAVGGVAILILLGYNLTLYVMLFMLAGLLIQNNKSQVHVFKSKGSSFVLMLISIGLFAALSYQAYTVYSAQIAFRKAFQTDDGGERYRLIRQAIRADSTEDFYIREGIFTNLLLARAIAAKEEVTDQDRQYFQQLIAQAINDSRVVTEIVDPTNVANWEARGIAYSSIMGLLQGADQFAIGAYQTALNLESTNPRLWVDLGGIYYRMQDYQNAVNAFARAVQLKPDYANAHYNLAYALRDAGALTAARTQMEIVARLIPQDDPAYARVQEELEVFKTAEEEAIAQRAELLRQQQEAQAAQQAAAAAQAEEETQIREQVPNTNPAEVERLDELEEPLENPEEQGEFEIEDNEGIDVPEDVIGDAEEEEEAPLANPPEDDEN